jgi:cyclin C
MSLTSSLHFRVTATASVYFRRFYLRNCFCHVDPRLVYVGCVYLASKAEESVLPAKPLVAFMKKHRPGWNYDIKNLLDIEMVISCSRLYVERKCKDNVSDSDVCQF